jgi:hypothetical protein
MSSCERLPGAKPGLFGAAQGAAALGTLGAAALRANEVPTRIGQDACARVKAQLGLNGASSDAYSKIVPEQILSRRWFRGCRSPTCATAWKSRIRF